MSDLTSRLDRWLEFHDEMGTPVRTALGPGLTDSQLARFEGSLGYPLLPEVREFMSWHTSVKDGVRLLPGVFGNWLQPNQVLSHSTGWVIADYWEDLPEWGRPSMPIRMVQLFTGDSAIDHAEGQTKGGVYNGDETREGWFAPSFSHLIDVCLEYAERGWLELELGESLELNAIAEAAASEQEATFQAGNPTQRRASWSPHSLGSGGQLHLLSELRSFRLDAFKDPSLSMPGRTPWIW